jgi:hypothetical protein
MLGGVCADERESRGMFLKSDIRHISLLRNKKISPLESTTAFLVSFLYLRAKHVEELS